MTVWGEGMQEKQECTSRVRKGRSTEGGKGGREGWVAARGEMGCGCVMREVRW